jgi:hypothetical protein
LRGITTLPAVEVANLSGDARLEFFAQAARKLQDGALGGKARQAHLSRVFVIALLGAAFALFAATKALLQLVALRPGG